MHGFAGRHIRRPAAIPQGAGAWRPLNLGDGHGLDLTPRKRGRSQITSSSTWSAG
jgi:hypothetical protein